MVVIFSLAGVAAGSRPGTVIFRSPRPLAHQPQQLVNRDPAMPARGVHDSDRPLGLPGFQCVLVDAEAGRGFGRTEPGGISHSWTSGRSGIPARGRPGRGFPDFGKFAGPGCIPARLDGRRTPSSVLALRPQPRGDYDPQIRQGVRHDGTGEAPGPPGRPAGRRVFPVRSRMRPAGSCETRRTRRSVLPTPWREACADGSAP